MLVKWQLFYLINFMLLYYSSKEFCLLVRNITVVQKCSHWTLSRRRSSNIKPLRYPYERSMHAINSKIDNKVCFFLWISAKVNGSIKCVPALRIICILQHHVMCTTTPKSTFKEWSKTSCIQSFSWLILNFWTLC